MTLVEFYENVIESLGLTQKDGFIYVKDSKGTLIPLMDDKKQLVLPTPDQLGNFLEEDDDGNISVVRIPYNPLNEDSVKGDSISLKKTKLIVEQRIGYNLAYVGELLLRLAANKELQKKTNIEINKFLAAINAAKGQNVKEAVDNLTIDNWTNIFKNSLRKSKSMISIYLKKAGISSDGEKYHRLAVMDSPIYEEILKATKDVPVLDVKLRNKDIIVFKALMDYLLPNRNSENCIEVGSNDLESPAFVALYTLYINMCTRTNRLIDLLKHVSADAIDTKTKLPITTDDLLSLAIFKKELLKIPNENELVRDSKYQSSLPNIDGTMFNKTVGSSNATSRITSRTERAEQPMDYHVKEAASPLEALRAGIRHNAIPTPNVAYPDVSLYGAAAIPPQPQYQPVYQSGPVYPPMQQGYGVPYANPVYGQQVNPYRQDINYGYPNTTSVGSFHTYR